jgi:hypothetical protein
MLTFASSPAFLLALLGMEAVLLRGPSMVTQSP